MVAESIQYITENPIFTFILLLLVSLTIPPIFERLNLPGLVGLLFAGIILGENALVSSTQRVKPWFCSRKWAKFT